MYSAEFDCMFYTYTLMGGIILIAIIMSNVFGFGIISSYHLSFEVTLQERVMRFQMQERSIINGALTTTKPNSS